MNFKNHLKEITFLSHLIKPYKFIVILLIFGSFLASVFEGISIGMLVPLLSSLPGMTGDVQLPAALQWIKSQLQPYSIEKQLLISLTFVVVSILLKNLFLAISVKLGCWLSSRLTSDLRFQIMAFLMMKVGIDFHHKSKVGDLIEKAINNTVEVEYLIRKMVEFIANLLIFLMLFILLVMLSWQLTIISFFLGTLLVFIMSVYIQNLSAIGEKKADNSREMLNAVHENISGIQLIKSSSKERDQLLRLKDKIEACRQSEYQCHFKIFSVHLLTEGLGIIAIGMLFIISMRLYEMNSQFILVLLLPFIYVLTRIIPKLNLLNAEKAEIVSRWPFLRLVKNLLDTDNKSFISNGHQDFCGLTDGIRFQSVTFSYNQDEKYALRRVDLSLPARKTTAIIGQSGAGKSTIVNLLLRFYDPQLGKILIDGEPLEKFKLESYRRKIGIVSQDTFLFHNTIKYNIAFGSSVEPTNEHVVEAAQKAGAHDFIMALPRGYETVLGERGITLSGGQRQRLSIARAILKNPEILILDEATSSLDTETEQLIHHAILEFSCNRTVIIIAHRLSTIKKADQIVVLKNGCVIETGKADQLYEQKGEYYQLVNANLVI